MDNKYKYFTPKNEFYMIVLAVFVGLLIIYAPNSIRIGSLVFYTLLLVFHVFNLRKKTRDWKRFVEDFSTNLDSATKNTLVNLPFPLIIAGVKGNILWYNQKINLILTDENILGKNINSIIKEIVINDILDKKTNFISRIKIKDKFFDIYISAVDSDEGADQKVKMILFYFYDITKAEEIKFNAEETREAVMLIEVDNLEEVVKTTEDDKKLLLVAEIERTINTYAQGISGMLKKYDSNKYIVSMQDKFIVKEAEKKFEILDIIREINVGNKLAVTLSIGVGRRGSSPLENQKFAVSAKELALSRGGDQVVLKTIEKLDFFGGKTKEVEKRTKVRSRVVAQALSDLIKESSNVFIIGHKNPDIDCLGSAIGINSAVKNLDKPCYIYLEDMNSSMIPIYEKFSKDNKFESTFVNSDFCYHNRYEDSLLILVDVHSKSYVQNYDLVKGFKRRVIIDHHRKSSDYIEDTLISYIEPYASSSSELVTEMLQYMVGQPKITRLEAEALLAGITVDTKNFSFKTGVRTFEAAAFLRRQGADTTDVKKLFSNNLISYISKLEIIKNANITNNIAVAAAPNELEDLVIIAQVADELLNITGVQASFVLGKIDNEVFISARSYGEINVQVILESLGGGGHMTIAGTKLNTTLEEAKIKLQESINKYFEDGEKK
ncbi:MAG TPA: DHH family phosphoesterase [Clostridiaceae bacterium]